VTRLLITGAGGNIGSVYARHAAEHGRYELRLTDLSDDALAEVREVGEAVAADLGDLEALKRLCEGVDTVVHMAADPSPSATWDSLLDANIVGAYNTFVAAKAAGCRRVVYASSIHAVSGYPTDVQVKTTEPVNPGDLYGVTKCFGEAMARYMAEQEGLEAIAVRIGAFEPDESAEGDMGVEMLDYFVSQRDMCQLLDRCVDAEIDRFAIVHGLSDNYFKRLDLSDTRKLLGYEPQDDTTEMNPKLRRALPADRPTEIDASGGDQESGLREDL
jgi:NAD(P)-dependent dehydrogenase (short-subunit alcohol dehydrogenase family)